MSKLSTDIKTFSMNAMGWAERAEALEKQVKELKAKCSFSLLRIGTKDELIVSYKKQVKELEDSISKMYMLCVSQKYDEVENILNNLEHGD